jgi:predicted Zn-ribbon and HTH transcriptional regulator
MAKCEECEKEMSKAKSCSKDYGTIMIDGKTYKRDTKYFDINKRCHDCGIENKKGNLHHFSCDMERCPKCKGQLISCDCNKE